MSATGHDRGNDQTLRNAVAFLRSLYEQAAIGIEQVSPDGRLLMANTPLCRMLGYSQHELLDKRFDELFPIEDRARENRSLQSLFAGDVKCYDGSKRFLHRSGALIRASVTSFIVGSASTRFCFSIVRDASALSAARAQLGLVIDSSPTPMLLIDEQGTIVLANSHAEQLFAYRSGELPGQSVEVLVPDTVRSKHSTLRQGFSDHPEKRTIGRARELLGRCKDGTTIPVEITLHPVEAEGNKWVLASIVDNRERQRATVALAKSEEKFAKTFHEAPIAMTLTSTKDGRYLDVNEKFVQWTGYTRDEVIGRTPFDMRVWASDPELRNKAVRQILAGGKVRDWEFQYRTKAGEVRTAMGSMEILEIDGEQLALGAVVDITDRKKALEQLQQSEKIFRTIFENAPEAMMMASPEGKFLAVNHAYCDFLGYTQEELLALDVVSITPPDDQPSTIARLKSLGTSGDSERFEKRYIHKNGQTRWGDLSRTLIRDAHGDPLFMVSQIVDITERREMEAELRQSEAALKEAQRVARVGSWTFDLRTDAISWSDEMYRIHGRDPILGPPSMAELEQYFTPESWAILLETRSGWSSGDTPTLDVELVRPDGEKRWITTRAEVARDSEGRAVLMRGTTQDINDRKLLESAMRRREEELKEAQRVAQVGSWEWDPKTDNLTCSEELSRIAGVNPSELGPKFNALSRFFSPEAWEAVTQNVDNILRTGEPAELDLPAIRANGEAAWITARGEAVRDASGNITHLRGTIQDITIRKRAEEALRGLSGKLIETQERERKRIARELHDDINQRLAIVAVELQQLQTAPRLTPAQLHKQIEKLFNQTTSITSAIQALSHQLHSASLEYLGLARAIKSLCEEITSHHQVDINYTSSNFPDVVPPDTSLAVFRVAQESLNNAVKHSGIKKFDVHLEGFPDAIELTVRDAGVGFGPDAAMAGRGLGLISMRERILALNGTVSIVSIPQHGTEVRVRVPLVTNARN